MTAPSLLRCHPYHGNTVILMHSSEDSHMSTNVKSLHRNLRITKQWTTSKVFKMHTQVHTYVRMLKLIIHTYVRMYTHTIHILSHNTYMHTIRTHVHAPKTHITHTQTLTPPPTHTTVGGKHSASEHTYIVIYPKHLYDKSLPSHFAPTLLPDPIYGPPTHLTYSEVCARRHHITPNATWSYTQ